VQVEPAAAPLLEPSGGASLVGHREWPSVAGLPAHFLYMPPWFRISVWQATKERRCPAPGDSLVSRSPSCRFTVDVSTWPRSELFTAVAQVKPGGTVLADGLSRCPVAPTRTDGIAVRGRLAIASSSTAPDILMANGGPPPARASPSPTSVQNEIHWDQAQLRLDVRQVTICNPSCASAARRQGKKVPPINGNHGPTDAASVLCSGRRSDSTTPPKRRELRRNPQRHWRDVRPRLDHC
jgi:hypothetical protein